MDKESAKTATWNSGKGGKREGAGRRKVKPDEFYDHSATDRDREFFAEFEYPIEMIINGTFRLIASRSTKIDNFKKAFAILKEINERGVK